MLLPSLARTVRRRVGAWASRPSCSRRCTSTRSRSLPILLVGWALAGALRCAVAVAVGVDHVPLGVQRHRRAHAAAPARERGRVSGSSQHLTLFQDRCDQCGACRCRVPAQRAQGRLGVHLRRLAQVRRVPEVRRGVRSKRHRQPSRAAQVELRAVDGSARRCEQGRRRLARRGQGGAQGRRAGRQGQGQRQGQADEEGPGPEDPGSPETAWFARHRGPRAATCYPRRPTAPPSRPPATSQAARPPVAWTLVDAAAVLAVMLLALVAKNAVLGAAAGRADAPAREDGGASGRAHRVLRRADRRVRLARRTAWRAGGRGLRLAARRGR